MLFSELTSSLIQLSINYSSLSWPYLERSSILPTVKVPGVRDVIWARHKGSRVIVNWRPVQTRKERKAFYLFKTKRKSSKPVTAWWNQSVTYAWTMTVVDCCRFTFAMRLLSNRSQNVVRTRKSNANASPCASVSLKFLPHLDVFCDELLNRRTVTRNVFLHNKESKKVC